jgi:hypothetical protein
MPTGTQVQARITTQDKSLTWKVPADQVGRRFGDKTEKVGFFNAALDANTGCLEIGERVPDEKW